MHLPLNIARTVCLACALFGTTAGAQTIEKTSFSSEVLSEEQYRHWLTMLDVSAKETLESKQKSVGENPIFTEGSYVQRSLRAKSFQSNAPVVRLLGSGAGSSERAYRSTGGKYTELAGRPEKKASKLNNRLQTAAVVDLWRTPIEVDISTVRTVHEAMSRMIELVGYQFLTEGRAVDREAVLSLDTDLPVSMRQMQYIAPDLRYALQAMAGPGLIVVVDHVSRKVSVDMGGRGIALSAMREIN